MVSFYDDDDEPLQPPAHAVGSGVLVLNTLCEYPAVPNDANHDGFAVMVHVKAPALVTATPLDLVALLDVRESMAGAKLAEVKRAVAFVIDNLGPCDRLSVVAFSDDARRIIRLTRMTDDGKAAAKSAVESLVAAGSADVRAGLDEAEKMLADSRHQNHIASVILISGGQGNTGDCNEVVVPPFLRPPWPPCGYRRTPLHTFLLGSDNSESCHDAAAAAAAAAMHNISEVTGGMFSFIEDHAAIQDALARCIGGLLSTVGQDACINVECWCDDMVVNVVKSGRYKSHVADGFDSKRAAWVDIDDLYADEERRFLLFLDVPAEADAKGYATRLPLVKVTCNYTDMASWQSVDVADLYAEVLWPINATPTDVARCVEVQREVLRVAAAEDMALAREAAERGAYDEAARILNARREALIRSAPALSGDAQCRALAAELHELSLSVSDEREYRKTGRACFLAGMGSHARQRGSSGLQFGCVGSGMFVTPAMRKMEKLSEMYLEQRRHAPEYGRSKAAVVPPRSHVEARLLPSAGHRLGVFQRKRRPVPLMRLANATSFSLVRPSVFCPF